MPRHLLRPDGAVAVMEYEKMPEGFLSAAGALLAFALLMAAAAGPANPLLAQDAVHGSNTVNCNIHEGSCTRQVADLSVTLEINPRPVRAMSLLNFKITLAGQTAPAPITPFIDLDMPGMYMGPNIVRLKAVGAGVYTGQGIVVKCPSGSRIWRATVTIPGRAAAEFIFDVLD